MSMDEPPEQPQSAKGIGWVVWLLATVVLPAIAGAMNTSHHLWVGVAALVLGFSTVGLHLAACAMLDPKPGCLPLFLVMGGWGLMLVSWFYGCAAGYSPLMNLH